MANTDLTGADGSIAWATLTGGTNAPEEDRAVVVRGGITRSVFPTTRPLSLMQRVAPSEWRGRFTIRVIVTDDGTPPKPINTVGTLTVNVKSGQSYAMKVMVVGVGGIGYNALTGEPQFQDYDCVLCSTATTDTVTVT